MPDILSKIKGVFISGSNPPVYQFNGGTAHFKERGRTMNRKRDNAGTHIHINPNRCKTPATPRPSSRPQSRGRSPSPSIQRDDLLYDSLPTDDVISGRESETIFIQFTGSKSPRDVTPVSVPQYGAICSDTAPLLNGAGTNFGTSDSHSDQSDHNSDTPAVFSRENLMKNRNSILRQVKIIVLIICAILCTVYIIIYPELTDTFKQISLKVNQTKDIVTDCRYGSNSEVMFLTLKGSIFDLDAPPRNINVINVYFDNKQKCSFPIHITEVEGEGTEVHEHFNVGKYTQEKVNLSFELLTNMTDTDISVPLDIDFHFFAASSQQDKLICAFIILVLVYGLIIFDLVHRTLAAALGSLAAIAVMSAFGMRPTLETIISWLDIETLCLLFGMMVIVAIFSETGFFDYCALVAYKLAKGKVWPLITLLCVFSAIVSAFLDNVTTILLLTPVTIRLCEVLNLDPKKILMAEVLFSNIGGTATAIGDPPNVIIVSDKEMKAKGIDFSTFTGHMVIGIVFASIAGYLLLRFTYRNIEDLENKDPSEITELKHEIEMWRRAAGRMVPITREENVMKALFLQQATVIENTLIRKMYKIKKTKHKNFQEMISELEKKYKITDKVLLVKSAVVLTIVIIAFFTHSFVSGMHVSLGWIAIMGAIWLMVLSDIQELETIFHRVEWSTLIFFAGLFSLMEALAELGLIDFISDQITSLIRKVDDNDNRLLAAIMLILWIAAIASSFIDNIPFTTAMVPVLILMEKDEELALPLLPLVLALAFGACLGGNGTLIGASANVVCAGIAEQHGYGFTFWDFFKVGFPMMLVTTTVASVYLIICHVVIKWNS